MLTKKNGTLMALALAMTSGFSPGCGGTPAPTPDGGPLPTDSGPIGLDTRRSDSGMPAGDGNDSFAEAAMVTLGTATEPTELSPTGDVDYYRFDGTEGQWIGVFTETAIATDDTLEGVIDTVVTLFDSSMTQIAENDDGLPRVNTDSALYTRLPAAGTYYVRVQDYNTWMPDDPQGDRTNLDYTLTVAELGGTAVSTDAGGNDTAMTAQRLNLIAATMGTQHYGFVAGGSDGTTDVDVYAFTVATGTNSNFFQQPGGATGSGSTGLPARMWVTLAGDTTPIARVASADSTEMSPPLNAGEYLLWVDPPAAAGANDFYYLRAIVDGTDNPVEAMEATNDVAATPEPLTMTANMAGTGTQGFILATLAAGDVDHYSFMVPAGQVVSLTCGSRTNGSGIVGLQVQLQTAAGAMVTGGSATETASVDAVLTNIAVPAAGTYLLRLSAASQSEVSGNWVRCGVYAAPPPAP